MVIKNDTIKIWRSCAYNEMTRGKSSDSRRIRYFIFWVSRVRSAARARGEPQLRESWLHNEFFICPRFDTIAIQFVFHSIYKISIELPQYTLQRSTKALRFLYETFSRLVIKSNGDFIRRKLCGVKERTKVFQKAVRLKTSLPRARRVGNVACSMETQEDVTTIRDRPSSSRFPDKDSY